MNMLDHQKKLIKNLSTDSDMVRKEVLKSKQWLSDSDFAQLKEWLKINYGIY